MEKLSMLCWKPKTKKICNFLHFSLTTWEKLRIADFYKSFMFLWESSLYWNKLINIKIICINHLLLNVGSGHYFIKWPTLWHLWHSIVAFLSPCGQSFAKCPFWWQLKHSALDGSCVQFLAMCPNFPHW